MENSNEKQNINFQRPEIDQTGVGAETTTQGKSMGAVIGSIIIIVILVVGGLYLWGKQIVQKEAQEATTADKILAEPDPIIDSFKKQGASDKVSDIEKDINSTELNNLDKEIQNINTELSL